jgi:signal transduction histidine kinase
MRLRTYLIILVTCTMAPLAAMAVGAAWLAASAEHARTTVEMQRLATAAGGAVDVAIGERLVLAQTMAAAPDLVTRGDHAAFERLARNAAAATGMDIIATNHVGEQFLNTWVAEGRPIDAAPSPALAERTIAAGGRYLIPLQPSPRTGEPVSAIIVATHEPGGENAFIAVRIEPERLAALLPRPSLWRGGFAGLFDQTGRMIAITPGAPDGAEAIRVKVDADGVAQLDVSAQKTLSAALSPVGTTGWHVAVGAPTDAIAAPLRHMTTFLAMAGLAGLAGAVLLAVLLGRFLLRQARALVRAASGLADARPPLPSSRVRELDVLRGALEHAGVALRERAAAVARAGMLAEDAAMLEARVAERTRDLEVMTGKLLNAEDEERRRIARELHDTTVQELIAASMALSQVEAGFAAHLPEPAARAMAEARGSLNRAKEELRTLSYVLQPPLLDELGLPTAIRVYAEGFQRRSGIAVRVEAADDLPPVPRPVETVLFRVLQEALTNVHRHSNAHLATVRLVMRPADLTLEVQDDGHGLLTQPGRSLPASGAGITGMRARLRQLGGALDITFGESGTVLMACAPLPVDALQATAKYARTL